MGLGDQTTLMTGIRAFYVIYSMSNFAQWPLHENYSLTEQN